ncbi:Imidazolonepropionase [Altererythrobacter xiamenensis]|uniref:Imidazolonepropionase n=1 Tax=Altererythrobacter xiamenensis TaxID=1316679 RepID=A0A1Y6F8W7_9SPHN|nr:amidohydrolase family protein [Altererythrobacter xiamenensis]SMQ69810.1 Imidazolonepropionase [Altererythrobacter xiamenensis]
MKFFVVSVAALCSTSALAQTHEYRVLFGGDDVGGLEVETEGDTSAIVFDYKQNGRGPTIAETVLTGPEGNPINWTITGRTTFGNPVNESYACNDGKAEWRDSTGPGSADACSFYIDQNGSPWGVSLLAKALLEDPDGEMAVLPGGTARIRARNTASYDGEAGEVTVTTYEITGLSTNPVHVTLDQDLRLFAVASPRFAIIRKGYEAADEALRAEAERYSTQRFVEIQAQAARNFDGPVRIRNVRIFDPKGLALTEAKDVVVSGERIASIQSVGSPVTEGETVIDGAGGTLVPGMYEMHGHIGQDNALMNLVAGVTSVRDMGNENNVLDGLIERIDNGVIAGPRITRSGFIEGKSEFSAATGEIAANQEEAIDLVRWYAARGYPQVKLYNSMNPEWASAVVSEAHELGMRVAGHVPAFSTADAMINAGFDEITHVNQLMLGWVLNEGEDTRTLFRFTAMQRFPSLDLDGDKVQSTLNKMAEEGVAHDPTIAIHELGLTAVDGEVPAGSVDVYDNMPVNTQRSMKQALFGTENQEERDAYVAAYGTIIETLSLMHEKGILLVPGTDLGGSFAYHRELELFEQIGMTPAQVLKRATYDMAEYLGQDEDLGSIEKGKYADFFLVAGDPTADLKQIKSIQMVVSNGTVYFPSEVYPNFGIKPFAAAPQILTEQ